MIIYLNQKSKKKTEKTRTKFYYKKNNKIYETETQSRQEYLEVIDQKRKQNFAINSLREVENIERREELKRPVCPHCWCIIPTWKTTCPCQE